MTNAMGHGVNQRDLIKMTPAEVDAFLAERRSMTMSTISGDGTIHSVAMWYGFLEGAVAFETKTKAQKVVNLRRDPRLTCLVEAGETYDQLRGVTLVGKGEIVEEPDRIWELGVSVCERFAGTFMIGSGNVQRTFVLASSRTSAFHTPFGLCMIAW